MKSTWKRGLSLILSLCLVFTMVPSLALADDAAGGTECYGYLYKGDPFPYDGIHYKFALYCVQKDVVEGIDFGTDITAEQQAQLNAAAEVVYCMDASRNEPTTAQASLDKNGTWPTYNKLAGTTANLASGSTKGNASCTDEEIARGLAWVASNGYPNSAFQGDMSVSDYRAVTQWAVYYWTMGRSGMTSLQTDAQKAAAAKFMTVPDDLDASAVMAGMSVYQPTANLSNPQWLLGFKATSDAPTTPNTTQTVEVCKEDLGGKGVVGAKLTITEGDDGTGTQVAAWETEADTSGNAVVHKVSGLETDKVYTLTETLAPKNFETAESIVFKVNEDGDVLVKGADGTFSKVKDGQVTMVDGYADHKVGISKVNLDGQEIADAQITVSGTELNGNAIKPISWTSVEGMSKTLELKPGTYTFHEEAAPTGYQAVTDITFSVAVDGTVKVEDANGNTVKVDAEGKLVVTDQYAKEPKDGTDEGDGDDGTDGSDDGDDDSDDGDGADDGDEGTNDGEDGEDVDGDEGDEGVEDGDEGDDTDETVSLGEPAADNDKIAKSTTTGIGKSFAIGKTGDSLALMAMGIGCLALLGFGALAVARRKMNQ